MAVKKKKYKTFVDLEFGPHPIKYPDSHLFHSLPRAQAVMNFDNGWGISVITIDSSYELAVIREDRKLHYNNPVADGDVVNNLQPPGITRLMKKVQQLPKDVNIVELRYIAKRRSNYE